MTGALLTRLRGVLALLISLGLLGTVLLHAERARSSGAEIVLETRPIDPRDLFFGNFATLRYSIERTSFTSLADDALIAALTSGPWEPDEKVWIALESNGNFHRPVLVTRDQAAAQARGPSLSAVLRRPYCPDDDGCEPDVQPFLNLPDRYYADPTTSLELERRARDAALLARERDNFETCEARRAAAEISSNITISAFCQSITEPPAALREDERFGVIMSVSEEGEAVIKGLYFDGQAHYDSLGGTRLQLSADDRSG